MLVGVGVNVPVGVGVGLGPGVGVGVMVGIGVGTEKMIRHCSSTAGAGLGTVGAIGSLPI